MGHNVSRRDFLKLAGAGATGAMVVNGADLAGLAPVTAAPQTQAAARSGKLFEVFEELGKWVLVAPTKFGGGTYALDLGSGKT
ncbi:MAG: twin-arginine translocation signal domain-containing protein, partial [Nitrospiraceae bacterium]